MHIDCEKFTLNGFSTEFPTTTIQSATDCFRLGRTINQFRRLCLPSTQPLSSVANSEITYSSINSLNTNEEDDLHDELPYDVYVITDDDEDDLICEINTHANHYRLCKAKAAHDAVWGKIDASLATKPLTANEAPHLDTKSLVAKLDEVAKTIDLDVSTILAEQIKVPVRGTVRSWIREGISPEPKTPEIQQSKALLRYSQEFNRLLFEEEGQLLCYNEPTDKLDYENLRICLPSTQSLSSVANSALTYSSINSLNTNEEDDLHDELPYDVYVITDDDEDDLICEINTHANHYRLCKAKAAHDAVWGKIDASLATKPRTANEAPHLDTKSLVAKPDEVAKTIDLDVSTILAEQIKVPVRGTVRSWIREGISPEPKTPEIQQSKALLRYSQEFNRLLFEEEGQLLCYNEPTDKLDYENLRICVPHHSS